MITPLKTVPSESAKPKNTREKIIFAARRVFAEKGYSQTRIQDLLRAAGVSPGAFYNYFSNKEELFLEIVREAGDQFRKTIRSVRNSRIKIGTQEELYSALTESIRYFFEFVKRNRAGVRILFREQQNANPRIRETLNEIVFEIQQDLKRDVQRGIDMGLIAISDPEIAAWGIISAVSGVGLNYLGHPKIEQERLVKALSELFLLGLFKRALR
jgi:AcrR family transcriptional regulator